MNTDVETLFQSDHFRRVLGYFCSGVTIVTCCLDGAPAGFACQSFFSLSLMPPLVAFAPAKSSQSYQLIRKSGAFCANILADSQRQLSAVLGRKDPDKWRDIKWSAGKTGSPILIGALAWIDCRIEHEYEGGDHFITVGRVIDLNADDGNPLLFFKGQYGGWAP